MKTSKIAGLVFGATIVAAPQVYAAEFADKTTYENNVNFSHKAKNGIKYSMQRRDLYGQGEWFYYHWDGRISYKIKSGLYDFGGNWRYIKKGEQTENRPYGFIRFMKKIGSWDLRNRSKQELRIRDGKDNVWRYKNKTYVNYKLSKNVRIDTSSEFTYDFGKNDWSSVKSGVGATFKINKSIKISPYYQYQAAFKDYGASDGWWTVDLSAKF